jgi:hypothetical protein
MLCLIANGHGEEQSDDDIDSDESEEPIAKSSALVTDDEHVRRTRPASAKVSTNARRELNARRVMSARPRPNTGQ